MSKRTGTVVYTALVGGYDYLRPVPDNTGDVDFICFADEQISREYCERKGWDLRRLPEGLGSDRAACRLLKSMPQKFLGEYDVSVWLDSNISFNEGIADIVDDFIKSPALVRGFRHPTRNCAYAEAKECILLGKDSETNINAMVDCMQSHGFPENHGLTETNVLFRKHHTAEIQSLNESWCEALRELTIRDQISFDYLCWGSGINVSYFEGSTHGNEHPVFNRGLHRSGNRLKNTFAYIESLQGIYPGLRRVINVMYAKFGSA